MALSCTRAARVSLASIGGHATPAERLELESHLAVCARCSAEHADLAAVRALRAAEPEGLSAAARERVRRVALAGTARAPAQARRRFWPAGLGATFALASLAALLFVRRPSNEPRVVSGDVAIVALVPSMATSPAADGEVSIRSARGGEVRLGDADTSLGAGTTFVWRRAARSVELREGSLTIDVEHRAGQHFQVRTPRFVVEVIGTRFTVDLAGVRTERGTVRVLGTDGAALGYVTAGRSWALPAETAQRTAPVSTAPAEAPPAPPPAPALTLASAGPARASLDEGPARLVQARRALARGNAGEARRLVEPIFHLGREVAVEARVIYAESFLVEGRYTDAVDGYETVVRDFPRTPQAESALYAVAQLESEHGRASAARAGLQRYLDRYPRGRFAREANDRLAGLTAPPR
jgi:ferric-dicitrate binding protein FerR (iron transport regulator)